MDNRKRGSTLSEARKAVLLMQWGQLATDARGKKVGVAALEAEFGLARGYISHHLLPHVDSLADDAKPFSMDISERTARVYSPRKEAFLAEQGEKWEGDFSWQEMADAVALNTLGSW